MVVIGSLLTAIVQNMLVVTALSLRDGVERPGSTGPAAARREPVLERVGEVDNRALTFKMLERAKGADG